MVRPLETRHLPHLLALLKLQDAQAELRTMSPESRELEELALELGELSPYSEMFPFVLERGGDFAAYVALCNYGGEAFLEGPLLQPKLAAEAAYSLVEKAVEEAQRYGYGFLEAFTDEENARAQEVLRANDFEPFRTTYIYEFSRQDTLKPLSPSAFRFDLSGEITASDYRNLYRETSDNWSTRLAWSDEELTERFAEPDVRLMLAYQGDEVVGHLELELIPEEGYAEIAYFGVLPHARGQKLGRALLLRGLHEALGDGSISLVLARAHDDERAASFALEKTGFHLSHGVVAWTLELG